MRNRFCIAIPIVLLAMLSALPAWGNKGRDFLWTAAAAGDLDAVNRWIEQGADLNTRDEARGWTPLLYAIRHGRTIVVRRLIDAGADVSIPSEKQHVPLAFAVERPELELTQMLLDAGADPNAHHRPNGVPLVYAARVGNVEAMRLLIERGADVNAAGHEGDTPIFHAAAKGSVEACKLLVEHGAEISPRSDEWATPIMWASGHGQIETTRFLIEHGADADDHNDGRSAVGLAAEHSTAEHVMLLIENGASIDRRLRYESPVLQIASARGKVDLARMLLKRGINPDQFSNALYAAALNGHAECIDLMLEQGATIRPEYLVKPIQESVSRGEVDMTVRLLRLQRVSAKVAPLPVHEQEDELLMAAHNGDEASVAKLLEIQPAMPDRTLRMAMEFAEQQGRIRVLRVLSPAAQKSAEFEEKREKMAEELGKAIAADDPTMVRSLLAAGADANYHKEDNGYSPMYWAATQGNPKIVAMMIERGGKVRSLNGDGNEAPLYAAVMNGNVEVVKLLLEKGADASELDDITALSLAAGKGSVELLEMLLDLKLDVNDPGRSGRTPLFAAAESGHSEAVQFLLKNGAEVNLPGYEGVTPLAVAEGKFHRDVVEMLRAAGGTAGEVHPENPLFWAVTGDPKTFKELIEKGADINGIGGFYETTLLGTIAYSGTVDADEVANARLLIKLGADAKHPPNMLAHIAFGPGPASTEMVKLLLENGADPNSKFRGDNTTALMRAAENGQIATIRILLDAGASIELKNFDGHTAIDIARRNKHEDVARLLETALAAPRAKQTEPPPSE